MKQQTYSQQSQIWIKILQGSSSYSMFPYMSALGPLIIPHLTIIQPKAEEMTDKGTSHVLKWGYGESAFCPWAPQHVAVKLICPQPSPTLPPTPWRIWRVQESMGWALLLDWWHTFCFTQQHVTSLLKKP